MKLARFPFIDATLISSLRRYNKILILNVVLLLWLAALGARNLQMHGP